MNESRSDKKYPNKKYYIDGFQAHQGKRVCGFFFGDYFSTLKMNEPDWRFDITLKRTIPLTLPIDIKQETVERILKLSQQGIFSKQICDVIRKETSISKQTPISEFLNIQDFRDYWGPKWKLFYEEEA